MTSSPKLLISATVLTKNSSRKLSATLKSLEDFAEVIVLDSGSSDNTEEIAKSFSNVKYYQSEFLGFGPMKQKASSYASHDWIMSVDSDEVLSAELLGALKGLNLGANSVYSFTRRNHYRGKWIKGCDWYPDSVIRLYNKKITNFSEAKLHEKILLNSSTKLIRLSYPIFHYPYDSVAELIKKLDHYSSIYAEDHKGRRISVVGIVFRTLYSFFRNYFLKLGVFQGRAGLLISFCSAAGVFYKYFKLLEINDDAL